MSANFVNDLLEAVQRVITPDRTSLKEVLIISGMPDKTQHLRYLSFNRQVVLEGSRRITFSAVALINNRRAEHWLLKGFYKNMSALVFNPRWTRNELDLFINALRCSPDIIALMAASNATYSLLGILEIEDRGDKGIFQRWTRRIRPLLAVPGMDKNGLDTIAAFERANEIRRSRKKKLSS